MHLYKHLEIIVEIYVSNLDKKTRCSSRFGHADKGHSPATRSPLNGPSVPRAVTKAKTCLERFRSVGEDILFGGSHLVNPINSSTVELSTRLTLLLA